MENAWARNLAIFCAALGWAGVQPAIGETSDATQLLAKYNCQACHTLDGVWGATPMPPSNVPDADLKVLVSWILAQK